MKKLYYIFFAVIIIYGCYEDKGNYNYNELAELEVSLPDESHSLLFGNRLQITPTIKTSIAESDLAYDWEFLTDTLDTWWDQYISVYKERELDFVCEMDGKILPQEGSYKLRLNITQLSTKRHFYSNAVTVTFTSQPSHTGAMVLHGNGTSSDIGVIVAGEFQLTTPSGSFTEQVLPYYYSDINGGQKIEGRGRSIIQTYMSYASYAPDYIVVFALTDRSSAVVQSKSFKHAGEWNDLFVGGLNSGDPQGFVINSSNIYVFDGGDIFTRQVFSYRFTTPFYVAADNEYDLYPQLFFPSGNLVQSAFFDNNSRGFIGVAQIHNFSGLTPISIPDNEIANVPFNPADMKADLIYMDEGGVTNHMVAVMKQDNGDYFMAEMDMNATSYVGVPKYKYDLTHLADVQSGKVINWTFGTSYINMGYYATSTGVYNFAIDAGQAITPEPLKMTNNDLVSFEGNITLMKILKPTINGGSYYKSNLQMVVGTYGGSAGSGKLYSIELDQFSGRAQSVKTYSGFDEIYDIDLKGW